MKLNGEKDDTRCKDINNRHKRREGAQCGWARCLGPPLMLGEVGLTEHPHPRLLMDSHGPTEGEWVEISPHPSLSRTLHYGWVPTYLHRGATRTPTLPEREKNTEGQLHRGSN